MLAPAMDETQPLHCMIEIPKGSRNKYEWDPDLQAIKLNRFLFSSVVYPTDYGFITETLGEVFGLTVRSRNIGSQLGAGLKSILGGELKGMTKALVDSRRQVTERMVEEAEAKGANAIIAMRFDTSEMGSNWTEICAYGTAVKARKA